ncbi:hypothetical protein K227x_41590 [Rubripirellula lacrimiformis]|uniref:Legionella pneumophila major outer membrane protein n=1 Tax=Rubripirellula lacrimiformis TaxID=1930273 RepID=A0A517NF72_9BACT|nr:Lpg1974 family pore-forming outer membrane protein [Rubripirellula lacrimiformis]QDT05755.1 hypothetical protein K227x_41590 [Rubripirellula lacrimiformis]
MRYKNYLVACMMLGCAMSSVVLDHVQAAASDAELQGPYQFTMDDTDATVSHHEADILRQSSQRCRHECPSKAGLFGESEVLFFHYNRADGNRSGNYSLNPNVDSDDVDFDIEASPRLTLGYRTVDGLGFRARYFDYSAEAAATFDTVDASMSVETYTLDFEIFDRFSFGRDWTFELSGGVRYNEFVETMVNYLPVAPIRENIFRGFGGIVGGEAQRSIGLGCAFYARGRGAILTGDKKVNNGVGGTPDESVRLTESIFSVMELASGLQYSRGLFNDAVQVQLRGGYEWQLWTNYSSSFDAITSVSSTPGILPSFGGPADVGFHGATMGMTLSF